MIIGIISDTHGNVSGWRQALEIFHRENVDLILHCGDILETFARESSPLRTALNACPLPILAVTGNMDAPHDLELLDFPVVPLALIQDGPTRIVAVHGDRLAGPAGAYRQAERLGARVFVRGHTHVPQMEKVRGIYMLNPGSAGKPRGENPKPTAIVLSPGAIRLYAIHTGDIMKEMRR